MAEAALDLSYVADTHFAPSTPLNRDRTFSHYGFFLLGTPESAELVAVICDLRRKGNRPFEIKMIPYTKAALEEAIADGTWAVPDFTRVLENMNKAQAVGVDFGTPRLTVDDAFKMDEWGRNGLVFYPPTHTQRFDDDVIESFPMPPIAGWRCDPSHS